MKNTSWFPLLLAAPTSLAFHVDPYLSARCVPRDHPPRARHREQSSWFLSLHRRARPTSSLPKPIPRRRSFAPVLHLAPVVIPMPTSLIQNSSILAAMALLVSALAGYATDAVLSNFGILTTLVTAATLSNLGWVPATHSYYDFCWSWFLPASLALLLLSFRPKASMAMGGLQPSSPDTNNQVPRTVRTVALPFVVGSISSFLGCAVSFLLCCWKPNAWLPPMDAAVAAGCLCASYIGGSVNFFQTATLLSSTSTSTTTSNTSLLSSMAAADLMVMAVYFSFLAVAVNSRWLQGLFGCRERCGDETGGLGVDATRPSAVVDATDGQSCSSAHATGVSIIAVPLIISLVTLIVAVANRLEATLARIVPGSGCAMIAAIASTIPRFFSRSNALWSGMQRVGGPLSQFSFLLLFASVGVSANLSEALRTGPACLWFSSVALCIHVMVTLGTCFSLRAWNPGIQLEDVLVASNAAIGGPATAAAFAGTLPGVRRQGWVVAATVWGVVGYAIATSIGIAQTRLFLRFL